MDAPLSRRRPRFVPVLGILVLSVGVFTAIIKRLDEDNRFCVSCHLHEEHLAGMFAPSPVVLAGAHGGARDRTGHPERCFTCHSGEGVRGWLEVTALSAWDAARWVAGTRTEPGAMKLPIVDAACLKCHADDVGGSMDAEETDEFHQLRDHRTLSVRCVECHVVHRPGRPDRHWLDTPTVQRQCARCHRDLDGGGSDASHRLEVLPGHRTPATARGSSTPARRLG